MKLIKAIFTTIKQLFLYVILPIGTIVLMCIFPDKFFALFGILIFVFWVMFNYVKLEK